MVNQEWQVAPFTGAWIEIEPIPPMVFRMLVAPFTGAWIEITPSMTVLMGPDVAPFTGAWIEMHTLPYRVVGWWRRSLHGSVD